MLVSRRLVNMDSPEGNMVTKSDLKKAIKDMEKGGSKKPKDSPKKLTTKERMNRIVEGDDPGYHL